jgi:hypothetical protein
MQKCNEECMDCCDFCYWYDFNADERGLYVGNGKCNEPNHLGDNNTDPGDTCNDFICFNVKSRNERK